jgi:hypothetical protein
MRRTALGSSGSGHAPTEIYYEHGKEPLRYIKRGEFLGQMSDCQVLKKGPS